MRRCRTCVMPDTRPDLHFDETGQCSACRAYERRPTIDWAQRKQDLLNLLDRHNGRCIVPSSGGKDSTAQVLTLLELGARPTVVTATTCHLTEIGRKNIDNLAHYAPTYEISPNKTQRAKLNRLGLEMVGDISWPEHVAIFTIPFRMACHLGIPLMFYGENPQDQYGGPPGTEDARIMTRRWVSEFGGFLGLRPADMVPLAGDMALYMPPDPGVLEAIGVEAHFLGQYVEWDSHQNAIKASEAGMVFQRPCSANWWAWENLDCSFTGLHCHGMYRKYGYGRGCAQISVDIRDGRIKRDTALAWLKVYDGLYPFEYAGTSIEEICANIGLTKKELDQHLDAFTNWAHFDHVEDGRPILKEFACTLQPQNVG